MLEIFLIIALTNQIGKIVEQKGYKSGGYKAMAVGFWIGGEILGAIIGTVVSSGEECVTYLFALGGAAGGAFVSYLIASNLAVTGPSLTPTETLTMPSVIGKFSSLVLALLWLATNTLGNIVWGSLYSMLNPTYDEGLLAFANITSGILAGMLAGVLQGLILVVALPKANRLTIAIWIPVTIIGWGLASMLYSVVLAVPTIVYLLLSIFIGLVLGGLQWFVLQKFSRIAIWWIPANVLDWVAGWVFGQFLFTLVSISFLYNLIIGVVSSIASCIAIVFILKKSEFNAGLETTTGDKSNVPLIPDSDNPVGPTWKED